jgi:hypothetical protein
MMDIRRKLRHRETPAAAWRSISQRAGSNTSGNQRARASLAVLAIDEIWASLKAP